MKKVKLIFGFVLLFNLCGFAQLAVEHFDYAIGDLTADAGSNWTILTGSTGDDAQVIAGNLSYTDYPMTATGNEVNLLAETYSTILMNALPFTRTNAGTIYASFLIQIFKVSPIRLSL